MSTGLHYLQSNDIIHRDLALRNLLVKKENGEYFIKISDLGMSTTTKYYSRDAEMIRDKHFLFILSSSDFFGFEL